MKSRFEEIRNKSDELINKVEELGDKNRTANEEIRRLNEEMENLRKFKEASGGKIMYYDKLVPLMEQEAQFKAFLIVEKVGSISIDDLRNAMGSPIVLVKKLVQKLQDVDLFKISDDGKISVKKAENN